MAKYKNEDAKLEHKRSNMLGTHQDCPLAAEMKRHIAEKAEDKARELSNAYNALNRHEQWDKLVKEFEHRWETESGFRTITTTDPNTGESTIKRVCIRVCPWGGSGMTDSRCRSRI